MSEWDVHGVWEGGRQNPRFGVLSGLCYRVITIKLIGPFDGRGVWQ